jgi:uncharacterized protein (DUF885 family)
MSEAESLYQSYFDLRWHFDPAAATEAGVGTQNGRLGDYDSDSMRAHLAAFRSISLAVEGLEPDDLQEEIDRTALLNELRTTLFQFEHEQPHVRNPVFWLNHLFRGLYALLERQGLPREVAAGFALARLRATPAFLQSATETLRDPAPILRDTAESMIDGGVVLLGLVARFCRTQAGVSGEEVDTAAADAEAALTRFGLALKTELASSDDIHAFAVGEEQFNRRLHYEHVLQSSAPELWRYGMHLVEETEAALEQLARELEPGTGWRALVEKLRQQTPVPEDAIAAYRGAMERSRAFVERHDLVSMPAAPLEVIATPEFLRPLVPIAAYSPPGPYSTDRTGRFYVTPRSNGMRKSANRSAYELPSLTLHEGYPGHHLHLATAQLLPSMVRRVLWSPTSVEGWALYCEDMLGDLGYYEPAERLFQKVHLLWRAVRILLDVGLHTRNMSPSAAVLYLLEKVPLDPAEALAEVRRYCGTPTYPLCYAIGRRDILALRSSYLEKHGPSRTLRAFHDELMSYGGLPVSLARWGMGLSEA